MCLEREDSIVCRRVRTSREMKLGPDAFMSASHCRFIINGMCNGRVGKCREDFIAIFGKMGEDAKQSIYR